MTRSNVRSIGGKFGRSAFVLLLIATTLVVAPVASAQDVPNLDGATVSIVNVEQGRYLEALPNVNVYTSSVANTATKWTLHDSGEGSYLIQSVSTGLYLNDDGGSTYNVDLTGPTDDDALWVVHPGDGGVTLENVGTGRHLDGNGHDHGYNVDTAEEPEPDSIWQITPVEEETSSDLTIDFAQYSGLPTIGNAGGNSDPFDFEGYGAMSIFVNEVAEATAATGDGTVTFNANPDTGRGESALRAGVQFVESGELQANPSWGFILNSVPFGMSFEQTLGFLYEEQESGLTGIELVNEVLERNGGSQVALPVVGSIGQGSGYFPAPVGTPHCNDGDADCESYGDGIGLEGMCSAGWTIRYLNPNQTVLDLACEQLVADGVIDSNELSFYPAVGGQSVLTPMQARAIDGFEFVTPHDDLKSFFPREATDFSCVVSESDDLLENGALSGDFSPECEQNIGEIGARYAHGPSWHQGFLLSWIHIDRDIWENQLTEAQRSVIETAARNSVVWSYNATQRAACVYFNDLLAVNDGAEQLDENGVGTGISADITLTEWPEEALDRLSAATDQLIQNELDNPDTPIDEEFSAIFGAWDSYRQSLEVGYEAAPFPARGCQPRD